MLHDLLKKISPIPTDSRLQRARKAVAFVRKEKDISAIMKILEAYKSTITLHFSQMSGEMVAIHRRSLKLLYASWLKPLEASSTYRIKLQGTCEWIWTENTFLKWYEPSSLPAPDRLLRIYGTHGCGKSILASSIFQGLRSRALLTLFFSFSGMHGDRQDLNSLVRTFLWQLLQESTEQQSMEIMNKLMLEEPLEALDFLDAFERAAKLVKVSVYCVIDGVDECNEPDRGLLNYVLGLLNALANFRIVLLGRPYALKATICATFPKIEIEPAVISRDIEAFIHAEIRNAPNLSTQELRDTVFQTLQQKSDGIFLWVRLMINDLRDAATKHEVMERLRDSPRGLEQIYRLMFLRLVKRLNDRQLHRARKVLAFAITSCRALTVDKLRYAYALDSGHGSQFSDHLLLQPDQGFPDVCGALINISNGLVQLTHISVKEFLTRPEEKWCDGDHEIKLFRVDLETTHRSLGSACVDYLDMSEWGFPLCDPDSFSALETKYPFLKYAPRYTISHLVRSGPPDSTMLDKINNFLESQRFAAWAEFLAMFMVHDVSNSVSAYELNTFTSWLNKGDHMRKLFEDKIRIAWKQALENRTEKFGGSDLRTQQWQNLLDVTEETESDFHSEVVNVVSLNGPEEPSDAISQILNLLNDRSILPLQKQVHVMLKLQSHLRKAKILSDPLKLLFRIILQKADKIPVYVLLYVAAFYDKLGKIENALDVYYAALTKVENLDVPIKFNILENIGYILLQQKKCAVAEDMYRQALQGQEKVLGKEHTYTLNTAYWLGCALSNQGKYEAAEEMFQRALQGQEKVLRKEHADTLNTAYSLGCALYYQGKYSKAEVMHQQALQGRENVLGKEHINTLDSAYWLGCALYDQEKYEAAEEIFRQALQGQGKVLGKEHIDTLNSAFQLGRALYDQEKHQAAEEMLRQAPEGDEKVLRKEHTDALNSAYWLGNALYNQRKYEAAEDMFQQALEGDETVRGKEHTDTLCSAYWLGNALYNQGKYEAAEEMFRQTLQGQEKVLRKEHTDTLDSAYWLSRALSNQGKYLEAEAMYERATGQSPWSPNREPSIDTDESTTSRPASETCPPHRSCPDLFHRTRTRPMPVRSRSLAGERV